jgi:hypothetical protein
VICTAGGTRHSHVSVGEVRVCWAQANANSDIRDEAASYTPGGPVYYQEAHPGSESRGADRHEEQWEDSYVPPPVKAGTEQATEPGVYFRNENWYLVVISQNGHPYAKVLEDKHNSKSGFRWGYQRGAIKEIRAMDKATAEQAGQFGQLYHVCVNCFKDLSRGESMRRGYGPDCAKNHGWPYNHSSAD